MPKPAEPAGAVIEGVIQVEQQRRARSKQQGDGADGGCGIRHVVEKAEAVAEILEAGRQAANGNRLLVELQVGLISQDASDQGQDGGGIMQCSRPTRTDIKLAQGLEPQPMSDFRVWGGS